MKVKKCLLLALCLACLMITLKAQKALSVIGGSSFNILQNTVVSIDGLVLQPSANYNITGANAVERHPTVWHANPPMRHIWRSYLWDVNLPLFSGNIGIYYQESELNGLAENELYLYTHNNSNWEPRLSINSRDAFNNVVTTVNLNNLDINELTLGNVVVLPVQWGPVAAKRYQKKVFVNWQTLNEVNVAHYEVERSVDGIQWVRCGANVTAKRSTGTNSYEFLDAGASTEKTYYRIKQLDQSGKYSYSPVVVVEAIEEYSSTQVYPNPVIHTLYIKSSSTKTIMGFSIRDAAGKLVLQNMLSGGHNHAIDVRNIPSGYYVVEVNYKEHSPSQHTFIKN